MKQLCCLATITFLSAQAYAGIILPDLSRSRSQPNLSPIAVGYSNRNSFSATFGVQKNSTDLNGNTASETTSDAGKGLVFVSHPDVHFELVGGLAHGKNDLSSSALPNQDTHTYQFDGSFAIPMEKFTAGVSAAAEKETMTFGSIKTDVRTLVITPGAGIRIQPNIALGLGLNYRSINVKGIVVGGASAQNPKLKTNEFFAGAAYGVDQKIGEDGLGVEAVISHTPKKRVTLGSFNLSQGATTSLKINGNYILEKLDFNFGVIASRGKSYNDALTKSAIAVALKPEYMVFNPFYINPILTYAKTKNADLNGLDQVSDNELWQLGLGAGKRTDKHDFNLTYTHGFEKFKLANVKANNNEILGRVSFYF